MKKREKVFHVPFLWILIPFAAGIFVSYVFSGIAITVTASVGAIAVFALFTFGRNSKEVWIASICLLSLCSGYIRHRGSSPIDLEPYNTAREATLSIQLNSLFVANDKERASGIATVLDVPVYFKKLIGQRIHFSLSQSDSTHQPIKSEVYLASGVIRRVSANEDEASNGFVDYLLKQGIAYRFQQGFLQDKESEAHFLNRLAATSKIKLSNVLAENARPNSPATGAYKALMLGQKENLSAEQKEIFLQNGAMHLFAISGLHIGIIAACIHYSLTLFRIPSSIRPIIVLLTVLCFVVTTGGAASSWRALLMTLCFYLCGIGRKQPNPLSALALSCIVYLLILPNQLFQAGFQMSYLTVASILLFGLPFARTLNRWIAPFARIPRGLQSGFQKASAISTKWVLNALAVSIAAYMTAALLGAYYFQVLPTYGILTNLIALPLASLAIIAGFVSILVSPIWFLPISDLFNNAALVVITSIQWGLERIGNLPYSSIRISHFSPVLLGSSLLCIIALAAISQTVKSEKRRGLWQVGPIALSAITLAFIANSN